MALECGAGVEFNFRTVPPCLFGVSQINYVLIEFFNSFYDRPSPIEKSELKWQAGVGD